MTDADALPTVRRPMVSVCMATYNGAAWIQGQVDSILAQLHHGDELLIQDDGSRDTTVDVLRSYEDTRIKIEVNPRNLGVIPTFERVLTRAAGRVVFLADQDDVWLPGKVDAVLAALSRPGVTGVVHDAKIVNERDDIIDPSYFAWRHSGPGVLKNFLANTYLGCCMAVRCEVLDVAIPIPRAVRTHDGWIGITANAMGRVVFLRTPYLHYRRHGGNVSGMAHLGAIDMVVRRISLALNLARIAPRAIAFRFSR